MNKVELLSPAGSLEKLKIALLYGADAVYIGGTSFSLRANAINFNNEELKEGVLFAHKRNKKVYVTVNMIFHDQDIIGLEKYLKFLDKIKVDAIIVADLFILNIVNKLKLKIKVHISTQESLANYEAISFLKKYNVERVVLARETSRKEIKQIKENTNIQLETFIHGAMCASYSGRCALSNYLTNRCANRGGCSQVCRFVFPLLNKKHKIVSKIKFTMSSKDLSMVNIIDDLIELGITSFKIEGRMRSVYYVATVVDAYRKIIDHYYNKTLTKEVINYYQKILNRCANRDSTVQFYLKSPDINCQYYTERNEVSNQDFLGIVLSYNEKNKEVIVSQRNYFKKGDVIEFFGPDTVPFEYQLSDFYNESGKLINIANHPNETIIFKLDQKVYQNDMIRIKL